MPRLPAVAAAACLALSALYACSDDEAAPPASSTEDASTGADAVTPPNEAGSADGGDGGDGAIGPQGPGPGPYTISYAGRYVGIDSRPLAAGKATFTGGELTSYEASADERPTAGTNQVLEASGDEFAAIGRWAGGVTGGKFYAAGDAGLMDFPPNSGFHYAIGGPADPLPSLGKLTYGLVSTTKATVADGTATPGTITGTLTADLAAASTKIGFSLSIEIPGDATYTIETTGGSADPSTSEAMLSTDPIKGGFFALLTVTSAGAACGGSCSGTVHGLVAGPNAERIALVAHIYSGSGGSPASIAAAALFTRP